MKRWARFQILAGLLMVSSSFPLSAQPPDMPAMGAQRFLFVHAVPLPAHRDSLVRVDVHYRVALDFFVALRNTEAPPAPPFRRRGEILIELVDSLDVTHARTHDRVDMGDSVADRRGREGWYSGIATFTVPQRAYRVRVELTDRGSQRTFLDEKTRVARMSGSPVAAFFAHTPLTAGWSDTLTPDNFGEQIEFSTRRSTLVAFPATAGVPDSLDVRYAISMIRPASEETTLVVSGSTGLLPVRRGITLSAVPEEGQAHYAVRMDSAATGAYVLVPLPTIQLPLRTYRIHLAMTRGTYSRSVHRTVPLIWTSMPASLRNMERALETLRYVASEEMVDSLSRGNLAEQADRLELFWKPRDQTPETALNEVMTEYYRRVDHATREFASLKQPDGFRSDRGRMYILNGPPSGVERFLDPGTGYREVWTYERSRKRLTFLDEKRNGTYTLVSTDSL